MKALLTLAAVAAVTATASYAQIGFSNGGVQLTYGSFSWDDSPDFTEETINAFAIFDISPDFDIQVGYSYSYLAYNPGNEYSDSGYDLHAIYNLSGGSRIGAFYGNHVLWESYDLEAYGLEYQYSSGPIAVEFQAGAANIFSDDVIFAAANANYAYGDFDFGAGYGFVTYNDYVLSKLSVNAAYTFSSFYDTTLFGEYAYLSSPDYSSSMSRIDMGVRIPFGAGTKVPFRNPNKLIRDLSIYWD